MAGYRLAISAVGILLLQSVVLAHGAAARTPAEQHAIAEQITQCSDDRRQMFASGLRREQYLLFCNCYVYSATDAVDDAELAYRREHNEPSPKFVEISGELVMRCIEEARNRLPD
jgi:hypothetical protein